MRIIERIFNKIIRTSIITIKKIKYQINKKKQFGYNLYYKEPLITIFGSCRQDSIYELYNVTSIRNNLTYPHYTKDIFQAIEYCKKSKNNFDELIYFRSSLLTKKIIQNKFDKEFNNTDVFIIEISSRKQYKYKNNYIHHEAYDNPEYKYLIKEKIIVSELSDEEIENDLIRIKRLLSPKIIILVTHIAVKNYGKRYELVKLLKSLALKLDIRVIVPYDYLKKFNYNEIFIENDSERHYSKYGHQIIKKIYEEVIKSELENRNKKKIVQVYTNNEERIAKHTYHGFGDFLMGSLYIYQISKKLNMIPFVSFNNHPISIFFENKYSVENTELMKVKYVLENPEKIDFEDGGLFFTNKKPQKLTQNDKEFIIHNCLTPTKKFEEYIYNFLNEKNISGNLNIIHVRAYDDEKLNMIILPDLQNKIKSNLDLNNKYLLLSSSNYIIENIKNKNIIKTNLKRCHIGMSDLCFEDLRDTLLEFILLTRSSKIIQFSVYEWGSNFSNIASEIYNIPIRKIKIC